ncbi:MAG: hypothetical protein WA160_04065 [Pseudobdellovibrio sp.]
MKKIILTLAVSILSSSAFAGSTTLKASTEERLQNSADVDYVEFVKDQDIDAKIFSVSGGDPAMNGAYLNLAVFAGVETGWTVYELANVRNYKLLKSTKKGYLKISLSRDTFDLNDNIIQKASTLYINITNAGKGVVEIEETK